MMYRFFAVLFIVFPLAAGATSIGSSNYRNITPPALPPPSVSPVVDTAPLDPCLNKDILKDNICDVECPHRDLDCLRETYFDYEDVCEEEGWYGDGSCDPDCPRLDPDCKDRADTATPTPTPEDGDDICALYGWYGDDVCDEECLYHDPDCPRALNLQPLTIEEAEQMDQSRAEHESCPADRPVRCLDGTCVETEVACLGRIEQHDGDEAFDAMIEDSHVDSSSSAVGTTDDMKVLPSEMDNRTYQFLIPTLPGHNTLPVDDDILVGDRSPDDATVETPTLSDQELAAYAASIVVGLSDVVRIESGEPTIIEVLKPAKLLWLFPREYTLRITVTDDTELTITTPWWLAFASDDADDWWSYARQAFDQFTAESVEYPSRNFRTKDLIDALIHVLSSL